MDQIPFNSMPADLRLPGGFIEISNLLASQGQQQFKVLFIGQRLTGSSVVAGVQTQVTRPDQADTFFGRGSMLAEMMRAGKNVDNWTDTWAIALDDDPAGAAATGSIKITGPATKSGTLMIYIAGKAVKVGVVAGDTSDVIATDIITAITANTALPVTAVIDGADTTKVNLTARHKGEVANDIDIRLNYYGESTPAGVQVAIVGMSGGTTNPDIVTALSAIGAEWFNWIVMPYADTANVLALESELNSLWGPTMQRGARAFASYRGNHAATSTFTGSRNSPHITWLASNLTPQPPYIVASINAMAAVNPLMLDPARPLHTLVLKGMMAPSIQDRWDDPERNLLLFDGAATYTVDKDGTCRIERQITSYQTNAAGLPDVSYLDINRPETLERIRYEQRASIASKFIQGRYKLSSDTNPRFGAGQPILTEDTIKSWLFDLMLGFIEDRGWCQDFDGYKATVVIVIDTANGKVSWSDEPRLIGQARTFAGLMQFEI